MDYPLTPSHGAWRRRIASTVDAPWRFAPVNLQPWMRSDGDAQTTGNGGAHMIGLLITIILIVIVLRLLF